MQCEKFYNLQNKINLIVYFLFLKKAKLRATNCGCCEKPFLFYTSEKLMSFSMIEYVFLKTEYTKRWRVKSSTIYKEQLILIMYFSFSKFHEIKFHYYES